MGGFSLFRCPGALNEDHPPFVFAGIWTKFKGDRGTKWKPIPGPHNVHGFLTTAPNAVVEPIRPKAMPVIPTADEETTTSGCERRGTRPGLCNARCRGRRDGPAIRQGPVAICSRIGAKIV
jgi:hypothetical protein